MKSILLTLFIIPFFMGAQQTNDTMKAPIVLELFTSQGCSSCPPADKLLDQVKSDNIIALSYHVDYWNYIGWKDPFSDVSYSNKQRKYATKFQNSTIYTPQLVINGKEHFVGSKSTLLNKKISKYSNSSSSFSIQIENVKQNNGFIDFDYEFKGTLKDKNLRIALVINKRTTQVRRGENRNKALINSNIVVNEQNFKLDNSNGKGSILIPKIVAESDELSLILIVEDKDLDIVTAAQSKLARS